MKRGGKRGSRDTAGTGFLPPFQPPSRPMTRTLDPSSHSAFRQRLPPILLSLSCCFPAAVVENSALRQQWRVFEATVAGDLMVQLTSSSSRRSEVAAQDSRESTAAATATASYRFPLAVFVMERGWTAAAAAAVSPSCVTLSLWWSSERVSLLLSPSNVDSLSDVSGTQFT